MKQHVLFGPTIVKRRPLLKGKDNEGIGISEMGEEYLLKLPPAVCLAEFVGAALCHLLGIPAYEATVVNYRGRPVFGGRIEAGLKRPQAAPEYEQLIQRCANRQVFSGVLAVDLCLGNYDRHWDNWLYQERADGSLVMRAIDFSRAWPTGHPPMTPVAMATHNTRLAFDLWGHVGIAWDRVLSQTCCAKLRALPPDWLHHLFQGLPVDWMTTPDGPALCMWWEQHWQQRVRDVETFLNNGAWT